MESRAEAHTTTTHTAQEAALNEIQQDGLLSVGGVRGMSLLLTHPIPGKEWRMQRKAVIFSCPKWPSSMEDFSPQIVRNLREAAF